MKGADATEKGADVRFPPPLVYAGGALLGLLIDRYVLPVPIPLSRAIAIAVGVVLMGVGAALPISARMHFKRTGQSVRPWDPTPELIFDGPYRLTRNPMYVGLTVFELGLGMALNNGWIAGWALPALAVVHFIAVMPEERYLSAKFGSSYVDYLTRVRRYI